MAENDNSANLSRSDLEEAYGASRCAIIELISTPSDVQLRLARQWEIDGPINATSFYEEQDGNYYHYYILHRHFDAALGTIIFFHVDHSGHLMSGDLKLRSPPSTPLQGAPLSNNSLHQYGSHLPIPNPFKSLMSHSAERLSLLEADEQSQSEDSKAWIFTSTDLGALLEGTPLGLRVWPGSEQGKYLGAAWTHEVFIVRCFLFVSEFMNLTFISFTKLRPKICLFYPSHKSAVSKTYPG